jgi:hypothetical protein
MIDALLHSVLDAVRKELKYDAAHADLMDDEMPPAACGDVFVSIHEGGEQSTSHRNLDIYYAYNITLTMKLKGIPLDRVGNSLLAKKLARESGWNKRADDLKNLCHMNWNVIQNANEKMVEFAPDAEIIYGFCEASRYTGREKPQLVGPEWFGAKAGKTEVGLKGTLHFDYARRFQPPEVYV